MQRKMEDESKETVERGKRKKIEMEDSPKSFSGGLQNL